MPVGAATLGRFLPAWQGVARWHGVEGTLEAIHVLAGVPLPAGSLESLVLPARVADYHPGMLDELIASGEVVWRGHARLPGQDGLVSLTPAGEPDLLAALRVDTEPAAPDNAHDAGDARTAALDAGVVTALAEHGAVFLPSLLTHLGLEGSSPEVVDALWRGVWQGRITNDSLAPLRTWLAGSSTPTRPRTTGRPRPLRVAPRSLGAGAGRWSLVEPVILDETRSAHALALRLLARHGVLTRAVAPSERIAGQFGTLYRVLSGLELGGSVLRGYFVEHLGGTQFALPEAVEALRSEVDTSPGALVLAASDPANPYGVALAWPPPPDADTLARPGRKAGAVVVLVDGELALFVERGGRSLLSFSHDTATLGMAARALAETVRAGRLGAFTVRRVDGTAMTAREARTGALGESLVAAGFVPTPQGLRLRG